MSTTVASSPGRSISFEVGEMKVPVYHSQEIQPVFVHPVPGYGGHLEGIKAENKHGGTYGMLRDGEDRVFGELWRKAGPQARPNNFLIGALPRYGGHVSAEIQWARKLETLTSNGPQGLGNLMANSTLDLFQTRQNTPSSLRRLQTLQLPDQQQDSYVSSFDKKGKITQQLNVEQKAMVPWHGKKHHVPGYSGHVPYLTQHVIGGTYSKGTVTAYDRVNRREMHSRAGSRGNVGYDTSNLDLSRSLSESSGHFLTAPAGNHVAGRASLPESFLLQREAQSRTLVSNHLARLSSRLHSVPQAAEVLGNLRADDRGFISGLCVKAALLDLAPALRMSDLEVREILYQLDKTASGEVAKDDLHQVVKNSNAPGASGDMQLSHAEKYFDSEMSNSSLNAASEHRRSSEQLERREGGEFQQLASELEQMLGSSFDNARQAFAIFDNASSAVIGQEEFRSTLQELGLELQPRQLAQAQRLLSTETEGQIDLKLFIRGIVGHDESMGALAKLNQSSHQMVRQPLLASADTLEAGMADVPSRKDSNSISQRLRAQWKQSYPLPTSAAPLRLTHFGGRSVRDPRRNSRVKHHSDHFHADGDSLRPHSSMEVRLLEEGGDALARLPVSITRRPQSQLNMNRDKMHMNKSSLKLGDDPHVRPSFNYTTTYATTFDPLANSSGHIF